MATASVAATAARGAAAATADEPLPADVVLAVDDLRTHFVFRDRAAKSVDGVTFTLKRGQTLAVVGEAGFGKSVTSLNPLYTVGDQIAEMVMLHERVDRQLHAATLNRARQMLELVEIPAAARRVHEYPR